MKIVPSADGTPIACDQGGRGPSLVLVHGTTADRTRWALVRPRLEEHFTVTAMDRRGRGDSGDAGTYGIEREFEDVAAVVASVESPVLLFGHSYGALCALGAALQSRSLSGLILYEPWIKAEGDVLYQPEQIQRLESLLAAGNREGVVKTLFAEIMGLPPQELDLLLLTPFWPARVAMAHTIPREARAEEGEARALTIPVLLLAGGDSPPIADRVNAMLSKLLPNARIATMPGQQHIAMTTGPDLLVEAILRFWRDIR